MARGEQPGSRHHARPIYTHTQHGYGLRSFASWLVAPQGLEGLNSSDARNASLTLRQFRTSNRQAIAESIEAMSEIALNYGLWRDAAEMPPSHHVACSRALC